MIKWFAYLVLILFFAPCLSFAKIHPTSVDSDAFVSFKVSLFFKPMEVDTVALKKTKKQEQDDKSRIKELAKAKKQPKPEKIEPDDKANKPKIKRQRRPEGLERPPEIPRRNGN